MKKDMYLENEKAELIKLKGALAQARDEMAGLRQKIINADQPSTDGARTRALSYLDSGEIEEAPPTKIRHFIAEQERLARTIALLEKGVSEQVTHIRKTLNTIKYEEYPKHPDVLKAKKVFSEAMDKLRLGLSLEGSARKDLNSRGLHDCPTAAVNKVWDELFVLKHEWGTGLFE